ncbi:MAG TPA: hypothetical protein VHC70_14075, partial [Phycisphaerales bacterium]|nr:hypothetical protein [Phycisphaerales bacterium]
AAQSGDADESDAARNSPRSATSKAPLPPARRAAPKVNLDAGEWAMQPGNVPASVQRFRWAVEEFRLALFDPARALKAAPTPQELERLAVDLPPPPRRV